MKNNNFFINIENCSQEKHQNYNDDISKSNLTIPKNEMVNVKKVSSSQSSLLPKIKKEFGKRYSFQDPELSFVTIHMKNSKK